MANGLASSKELGQHFWLLLLKFDHIIILEVIFHVE